MLPRFPLVTNQTGFNITSANQKTPLIRQPITLRSLKASPQDTQSKLLEASKQDVKNNEFQQDLKSLLLDVRTLISTFQSHGTPVCIPANHQGPQKAHDVESNKIASNDGGHWVDSIEHSNDGELDISLDIDDGYHGNIRPPLRSSSPKPDQEESFIISHDPTPSNDSYVTSLLSFSTAVSDNDIASSKRHKPSDTRRRPLELSNDAPRSKTTSTRKTKGKVSTSSK